MLANAEEQLADLGRDGTLQRMDAQNLAFVVAFSPWMLISNLSFGWAFGSPIHRPRERPDVTAASPPEIDTCE